MIHFQPHYSITKKKQMALQRKQDNTKDAELRKGAAQGK